MCRLLCRCCGVPGTEDSWQHMGGLGKLANGQDAIACEQVATRGGPVPTLSCEQTPGDNAREVTQIGGGEYFAPEISTNN